jgi:cell division protein FtsB
VKDRDVMRDIGSRLQRYRLHRYAVPSDSLLQRLRWALPVLALWLLWAGFVSDHSILRLWQLRRENAGAQQELKHLNLETRRLERELEDPAARRELAERALRERNGMAKPGEIVYRIRGASPDTSARPETGARP